jgi:NADH-quinone oxidoreductase subunit L
VPPLGGFFSKDALLTELEHSHVGALIVLLGAAVLTAAYAARAWLGTFLGRARSAEAWAAEEAGPGLLAPMALLAAGAVGLGLLALPPGEAWWARTLDVPEMRPFSWWTAALSFVLALAGVGWAVRAHRWWSPVADGSPLPRALRPPTEAWLGLVASADAVGRGVVRLARALDRLEHRRPARVVGRGVRAGAVGAAGIDRAAWTRITRGGVADVVLLLAERLAGFDVHALARASLEGAARAGRRLGGWTVGSDRSGIDRAIDTLTQGFRAAARGLTRLQTGLVHQYYALAAAGTALLLVYAFFIVGR